MRFQFISAVLLSLAFASGAHAQARYMPADNAYAYSGGAVNNPQPIRTQPVPNYRPERMSTATLRDMPRVPVYREASFREARISMPRNNPMPRSFRVDMNPAGRTPR